MSNIDFSIIFNSRDRVDMLTEMFEKVEDTCSNLDKIEVIVNVDDDDLTTVNNIDKLTKRFNFVNFVVSERELNIHTNVNRMAFQSKGDFIWAMGDDCHITTKNWDNIAKEKFIKSFEEYSDKIVLGAVESTSVDKVLNYGWYCDAPILTKEGRDALGYLIHPHFISAGADVATWTIYSSVGRVIDMREICFDHVTHNTYEICSQRDKTQTDYLERQMSNQTFNPFTYDYSSDIEKIVEVTNG